MKPISATSSKAQLHKTFALTPYPAPDLPALEITGTISRIDNHIAVHYSIRGDVQNILLPALSSIPTRKDDLWKATCLEFFIAMPQLPEYWEFNMSPSGDWNIYHMGAYRRIGFREETTIQIMPFALKQADSGISLDISVDLAPILSPEQKIQLGINAIIQTKDEAETYWALAHPGQLADFHLRDSFVNEL